MTDQYVTFVICLALITSGITIVLTQYWRRLKRWWSTYSWEPRLVPGIRAEVQLIMGDDGNVWANFGKIPPEDNLAEIIAHMTERWFTLGESMGVTLHWTSKYGGVIDTPDGPEYVVAIMRASKAKVREMTEHERAAGLYDRVPEKEMPTV